MRLKIALALIILEIGSSCYRSKDHSSELILFATVSNSPFQDSIYTVAPDGSDLEQLFIPRKGRSYVYASGNSLRQGLVVTVHEINPLGQVENHNYWCEIATNKWHRLLMRDGIEGAGYLSPDGSKIICMFNLGSKVAQQLHPWTIHLTSGETKNLTNDETDAGVWDESVSWRPDGQEILFVRLQLTDDKLASTLMRASLSGGTSSLLFGPDVGVVAACYAPDAALMAVFTSKGLEVVERSNLQRRLILPWSSLPHAQFRSGGLVWSRNNNLISFGIFNKEAKEYELWTVVADGSHAKKVLSQNEKHGRITVTGFIQI